MSTTLEIRLILAGACALAADFAFLFKHRGASATAAIEIRHPLRSARALFRSRWFALGFAVALAGGAFHNGALALAPLSLVQTVIAAGVVLLAVLAERLFAHPVSRRQWLGIALAALGLALLALVSAHGASLVLFPALAAVAAAGLAAQYANARALQLGHAVSVTAITMTTATVAAIVAGLLAFHDPLPHGPAAIAAEILGFALVCVAALLTPVRIGEIAAAQPAAVRPALRRPRERAGSAGYGYHVTARRPA